MFGGRCVSLIGIILTQPSEIVSGDRNLRTRVTSFILVIFVFHLYLLELGRTKMDSKAKKKWSERTHSDMSNFDL